MNTRPHIAIPALAAHIASFNTTYTAEITAIGVSTCYPDDPRAVDACIFLGDALVGEVTLRPDETGELSTWGETQLMWLDMLLDQHLDHLSADDARAAIDAIIAAVRDAAAA